MRKLKYIIPVFVMAFISVHCSNDDLDIPRDTLNEASFETLYSFGFNEENGLSTTEGETGTEFIISATGNEVNRMQGVEGNALFFDGLSTTVSGELPTMDLTDHFPLDRRKILSYRHSRNGDFNEPGWQYRCGSWDQ